jgi:hypothetical protein
MGIVAQNKPLKTDVIDATPIEELTMLNGEITSNSVDYKAKGKTSNDRAYTSSVKSSVTIKAKWLPIGSSNRLTPPDVRRGESVMIYQFGDSDKYYWTTLKQDCNLRRLETVVYAFSGTTNEADSLNADNSYYLEISTHRKLVTFHTSNKNGEPYTYNVQIDTGNGSVTITDDIGNEFILNSKESRVKLKNSSDSIIDVFKDSIIMKSNTSISMQSKNVTFAGKNIIADGAMSATGTVHVAGSMTINDITAANVTADVFKRKDGARID